MLGFASFLTVAGNWPFWKLTLIQIFRNSFRGATLAQPKPLNQPEPSVSGANPLKAEPVLAVRNERGFNLKMDIKKLNFNDQILIINSVLLGDKAKDNNSFTQRLLRWNVTLINDNQKLSCVTVC